jgi:hypothetical protein
MQRRTPPPPRRPGVVLGCSLGAMTMAGTIYWLPALCVAIAPVLSLSAADTAAVVAVANCTSDVLVLPGLLHQAIGPARTAIVGSFALAATYAGIAQLVMQQLANPVLFLLVSASTSIYIQHPPLFPPTLPLSNISRAMVSCHDQARSAFSDASRCSFPPCFPQSAISLLTHFFYFYCCPVPVRDVQLSFRCPRTDYIRIGAGHCRRRLSK